MIAIAFRFLAGRYHATPWGRHVNEGAVEWPPSPWRILRALIATWKRTLPEIPESDVRPIFEALVAAAPHFALPPASTGHTRHFMPWFKKGPDDRTLVFDTFVALARDAELVAAWPDATLSEAQRNVLACILANLNTLGRSESWCEATLLTDDEAGRRSRSKEWQRRISAPLNGHTPDQDHEIVRLICPDRNTAFAADHVVAVTVKTKGRGRNKQTVEQRSSTYDPAWHLCMETLQLHKERWSDPPGSRWVQYARPRDCFKMEAKSRSRTRREPQARIQVVRYALDSTVLPLVTETLPVAEAARRALMSRYGRLTEQNGVRGQSPVFAGKDEHGDPLSGHAHAYYLPTDEDGDGRLDHLTVFARMGLGDAENRTLDGLRELRTGRKGEECHPLRLLLLGLGTLDECQPGPLRLAREWISATPYIATRHAKTRGRHRIDLSSPQARADFLMADLRRQIRAVRVDLDAYMLGQVRITPEWDDHVYGVFRLPSHDDRRDLRPIQFRRSRHKAGDDGGQRLAGAFRLIFPLEVRGPIVIGWSSHFGMGLFAPVRHGPMRE